MTEAGDNKLASSLRYVNGVLVVPAAISLWSALLHGLQRGQDLQWSGIHLLLQHIDPYLQFLRGDPEHLIIASQNPNYLHELYVLLFPIGMLSFEKARACFLFVNLLLSVACVVLLGRIYKLDRSRTLLLGLILAMSAPFRIVLANGQVAMLEVLFLALVLLPVALPGFWFGLSYFKYSFSPVFFFYLAFQARWRFLLWSFVAPLAGVLVFWFFLHGNPFHLAIEPFLASRPGGVGVNFGVADIASILATAAPALGNIHAQQFGCLAGIFGSILVGAFIARRGLTDVRAFTVLAPVSLFLLTHLIYDYVLLLLPLAATLGFVGKEENMRRMLSFGSIVLLWFVVPERPLTIHIQQLPLQLATCTLLIVLFFCHLPSNPASAPELASE